MKTSFSQDWSPPRFLAVQVLTQVLSDKKPLDQVLDFLKYDSPKDRAWIREVCTGVLRWKTRLDHAIDAHALKKKPTGRVRKFLWIAVYQLIVQEQSKPAGVVFETVEAVRKKDGDSPAKFVNALLRRVSEERQQWRDIAKPKANASTQLKSIYTGLPESWVKVLEKEHGWDWTAAFGLASLERPQTWIHANPSWSAPKDFIEGPLKQSYLLNPESKLSPDLTTWPGFSEGQWIVQDLSSQQLIQNVFEKIGSQIKTVLDCCAAPGGKTIALSWRSLKVDAYDIHADRIQILKKNLERTKVSVFLLDSLEDLSKSYDLVLIDAPCSGSGILRRHPDVKWNFDFRELEILNKKQNDLVQNLWKNLKVGQYLVYSVCSVFKAESNSLIENLNLKPHVVAEWRFAPHLEPSSDGFYGVLLKK